MTAETAGTHRAILPGGRKGRSLLLVFGVYVVLLLLFASAYSALYRNNPEYFLVDADIQSAQSAEFLVAATTQDSTLGTQLRALRRISMMLSDTLRSMELDFREDEGYVLNLKPYRSVFSRSMIGMVPAGFSQMFTDIYIDSAGVRVVDRTWYGGGPFGSWPPSLTELTIVLDWLHEQYEGERANLHYRLSTLDTRRPQTWGFWDFFYFSTITQATVGYGEILPNHINVRLLVVLQVLIGLFLLVVVVNLLVTPNTGNGDRRGENP